MRNKVFGIGGISGGGFGVYRWLFPTPEMYSSASYQAESKAALLLACVLLFAGVYYFFFRGHD